MKAPRLAFVESNTSGTGRLFARAARREGVRPVLLTDDPSRYKFVAEEELDVLRVDTSDRVAVLEACRALATEHGLAGVTSSSEYFIATAAWAARESGLPGPLPSAVLACRDKREQRVQLQKAGVGMPAFRSANSAGRAVAAAEEIGFPVVVKPVAGTGSAGVRLCADAHSVSSHAAALLRLRRNERGMPVPRRVLVEECAVGPEFSVETFGTEVVGITQKHLGLPPHFVEVGHDFPAALDAEAARAIEREVLRSAEALGLTWGPGHYELRLTATGPKIIEVNPRLAGGFIPELVRLAFGVDLVSETVRAVLGRPAGLRRERRRHASIRFVLPPHDGVLSDVEGSERAGRLPGVEDVQLYAKPGDEVSLRGDFRDRIGHVVAVGETYEAARAAVEAAHGLLRPVVNSAAVAAAAGRV